MPVNEKFKSAGISCETPALEIDLELSDDFTGLKLTKVNPAKCTEENLHACLDNR